VLLIWCFVAVVVDEMCVWIEECYEGLDVITKCILMLVI
jgi:hypothetical protein